MKEKIKISFKRELLAGFLTVAVLPLVVSCLFLIQMFQVKADRDYRQAPSLEYRSKRASSLNSEVFSYKI